MFGKNTNILVHSCFELTVQQRHTRNKSMTKTHWHVFVQKHFHKTNNTSMVRNAGTTSKQIMNEQTSNCKQHTECTCVLIKICSGRYIYTSFMQEYTYTFIYMYIYFQHLKIFSSRTNCLRHLADFLGKIVGINSLTNKSLYNKHVCVFALRCVCMLI